MIIMREIRRYNHPEWMRLDTWSSGTDSAKERETQTSHTERQTDRQMGRQTLRQTDRQSIQTLAQ